MRIIFAILLLALGAPAPAQVDMGQGEIMVTGTRRSSDDFDASIPAVGLKRVADFAVQEVTVTGDTRDANKRHDEIYAMVRNAIELAAKRGDIEIATGETVVEPLTLANYRSLTLNRDNRPDSEKVSFLVKTRLAADVDAKAALDRIEAFVKAVQPVGRALIERTDDLTLSVIKPDQYRDQIVDRISADGRGIAARFGDDYSVEVAGLQRPVEWTRASLTEVFLYIPYTVQIVPEPR